MAASRQVKSSFTAGELAPEMLGRGDLRAYANGARRLRNVFLQPTGGLTRRPGLRHVATLPGPARLVAFEFNTEQTYLLVLVPGRVRTRAAVLALSGPVAVNQLDHRHVGRIAVTDARLQYSAVPARTGLVSLRQRGKELLDDALVLQLRDGLTPGM